jgi:hypothetical protein
MYSLLPQMNSSTPSLLAVFEERVNEKVILTYAV